MLHHIILPGAAAIGAGSFNAGGNPPTPASSCTLGGTITTADEDDIIAGGRTITLTLNADGWDNTLGADNAITTALIDGITSAQSEAAGWNAVVKAALTYEHVTRTSDVIATIELPACAGYAVTANETITVTVPTSAVLYTTAAIVASPTATVTNVAEAVVITGSSGTALTEEEVQTGSETLIFTVTGDQWVETLGDDNAITTAFLAGIDSAQSEAAGWDAEVKANLDYTMLVRDSATQVTLTLPASASYNITANETITATIPATALLASSGAVVATPTVGVSYASVVLTGTMTTDGPGESDIVTGGKTIIFTVTNDEWVATLGADNAITTAFLAGITSAQSESAGWNAEVRDNLTYAALTRDSATVCTLTLPASASYDITATETITCTIPATALVGSPAALSASPTLTVGAVGAVGVLFSSDWSVELGSSTSALTDGGAFDSASAGYNNIGEVIQNDGHFAAGFANCLQMNGYVNFYYDPLWKISPYNANVAVDLGAPSGGDHRYSRFYWRYDITDPPNNNDGIGDGTWGGTHPTEIGLDSQSRVQGSVLHKMSMPITGGTYEYLIVLFNSGRGTKAYYVTLNKATEYRIEEHMNFQSSTTFYYDIRVYDATGTLLFEGPDFTHYPGTSAAISELCYCRDAAGGNLGYYKLGQNSSHTLNWDAGPAREIQMFKFGGFCVRSDTWCGPYAGGV